MCRNRQLVIMENVQAMIDKPAVLRTHTVPDSLDLFCLFPEVFQVPHPSQRQTSQVIWPTKVAQTFCCRLIHAVTKISFIERASLWSAIYNLVLLVTTGSTFYSDATYILLSARPHGITWKKTVHLYLQYIFHSVLIIFLEELDSCIISIKELCLNQFGWMIEYFLTIGCAEVKDEKRLQHICLKSNPVWSGTRGWQSRTLHLSHTSPLKSRHLRPWLISKQNW